MLLKWRRIPADTREFSREGNWPQALRECHYLVAKTGNQGLPHATRFSQAINDYLASNPAIFQVVSRLPLPDGSEMLLYERRPID